MSPSALEILHPYLVAFAACFGAVVGSFLNVVIARVPEGRSIVHPRSACPACGAAIAWYDNVPVLSWLLLRARCRSCRAPISWRYPAVEIAIALVAVAAVERHGPTLRAAVEFAYVAMLVALAFIDLATWLLPHVLTRPLLVAGLVVSALQIGPAVSLRRAVYGAALGFAVLWVVGAVGRALLKKEAMGGGDLWLLAALGAWNGAPALLPILLLASVQGSLAGIVLIVSGKGEPGPDADAPGEARGVGAEARLPETPPPETSPSALEAPDAPGSPPVAADATGTPAQAPDGDEHVPWIPPRNAVPFGPFLVAAALEWLYLGHELARSIPPLELFR